MLAKALTHNDLCTCATDVVLYMPLPALTIQGNADRSTHKSVEVVKARCQCNTRGSSIARKENADLGVGSSRLQAKTRLNCAVPLACPLKIDCIATASHEQASAALKEHALHVVSSRMQVATSRGNVGGAKLRQATTELRGNASNTDAKKFASYIAPAHWHKLTNL